MTVQRYELADCGSPYVPWREMQKADDGEWVEFEDYENVERERDELRERIDLDVDEFQRIKNAIHNDALGLHGERTRIIAEEVIGLCDRAMAAGRQRVPLIVQRDRAENKNVKLRELLYRALELTEDIATDEAGEWGAQVRETLGEVER